MTSANGDPDGERRSGFLPRVSATSVAKFVGRKEADRVGS